MADRKNVEAEYVPIRTIVEDEVDELNLDLDLEYHDEPAGAEEDKPPSYEEVVQVQVQSLEDGAGGDEKEKENEKRRFIYNAIVATLTVLVCVAVVGGVGGYFLALSPDGPERPAIPESTSRNGALDFVEMYPVLDGERTSVECRAAWGGTFFLPHCSCQRRARGRYLLTAEQN